LTFNKRLASYHVTVLLILSIFKIIRLEKEEGIKFVYREEDLGKSNNIMDKWILSFVQSLVQFMKQEMKGKSSQLHHNLIMFHCLITSFNGYEKSSLRSAKSKTPLRNHNSRYMDDRNL